MDDINNNSSDVLKKLSEKAPSPEMPKDVIYVEKENSYRLPVNDPRRDTVEEIDIIVQAKWAKGSPNPSFHKIDALYIYAMNMFNNVCCFFLQDIRPLDHKLESMDKVNAKFYMKNKLREFFQLLWYERQLIVILKDIVGLDSLYYLPAPHIKELPENLGITCFDSADRSALDVAIKISSNICIAISPYENICELYKDISKMKITPVDPKLWKWYCHYPELIINRFPSSDWPVWKIQREQDRLICFIKDEHTKARKLCLGENSAMPEKLPFMNINNEALALAMKVQHPDWTDAKIAESISIHPKSLYRMPMFKAIKAVYKEIVRKENRSKFPKGEKNENGNIEAWDD